MDFTLTIYKQLLSSLQASGYSFQTFADFVQNSEDKTVVLRHDVDRLPVNALKMARLEQEMGVMATYYFRAVPVSWDEGIIREISGMGHEIGYHYENVEVAIEEFRNLGIQGLNNSGIEKENRITGKLNKIGILGGGKELSDDQLKRVLDLAYEDFCRNLEMFRKHFDVKTICMHGSPLSKYDNRMIWEKYDYRELGVVAEPYFDVDFSKVFYLTDTGRHWNHTGASIRDRVETGFDIEVKSTGHLIELIKSREEKSFVHPGEPPSGTPWELVHGAGECSRNDTNEEINISAVNPGETPQRGPRFHWASHSGNVFIASGENKKLPDKIMINVHPQRWHDRPWPWVKELVWQNVKNVAKAALVKARGQFL